jgi:hypothetical protein
MLPRGDLQRHIREGLALSTHYGDMPQSEQRRLPNLRGGVRIRHILKMISEKSRSSS